MRPLTIALIVLSAGAATAAAPAPVVQRPAETQAPVRMGGVLRGSPLAVDNERVFAVAADGRTIITCPADFGEPWAPVPTDQPFERISGLALVGRSLIVSDRASRGVYAVDLARGQTTPIHQGAPFQAPGDVATAGSAAFVVDDELGRVFQWDETGEMRALEFRDPTSRGGALDLAADGREGLIVALEGW